MNILFIGDVVGKPGRRIVKNELKKLQQQYAVDFTIVNGENAAHGKGITKKIYRELMNAGADVVTLGNHAYAKAEIVRDFVECDKLVFPANLQSKIVVPSTIISEVNGLKIAVTSIMCEAFMNNVTQSPYEAMLNKLDEIKCDLHIVDLHGEATGEKQTFFHLFKEACGAIIGTHTHVATADESISAGCAYISDVGMCGVVDSILGRDVEEVIAKTIYHEQTTYTIANGPAMLNGVLIQFDGNEATSIQRIQTFESGL